MTKIIVEWLIANTAILGFTAALLGTFSLVPQVIKTLRSRSVIDISLIMYIIISIDSVLWLIYGTLLKLIPLIFQSLLTFICAFAMVIMKMAWRNNNEDKIN